MTKKGEGALLRSRNLDDQTYAQIVEAAEGRLPWLCPEWTDHNAHDPGITVLELLAWYKELQQYHMNAFTDDLQCKLLKLAGIRRKPAEPAVCSVFAEPGGKGRLAGTSLCTSEGIPFELLEPIPAERPVLERVCVSQGKERLEIGGMLENRSMTFRPFAQGALGRARLELGFDGLGAGDLRLWFDTAEPEGVKRNPFASPEQCPRTIEWTCSAGRLEIRRDDTHALSRSGFLTLRPPEGWQKGEDGLFWLTGTLLDPGCEEEVRLFGISADRYQAAQQESWAKTRRLLAPAQEKWEILLPDARTREAAFAVFVRRAEGWEQTDRWQRTESDEGCVFQLDTSGSVQDGGENVLLICLDAAHADRLLFSAKGLPGETFFLDLEGRRALADRFTLLCRTLGQDGESHLEFWRCVEDFYACGPRDRVFTYNAEEETITFGDGRRGALPQGGEGSVMAAELTLSACAGGNIPAGENLLFTDDRLPARHTAAAGGRAMESVREAHARLLQMLGSTQKCVSAADYERLAAATPGLRVAAVKALPAYDPREPSGTSRSPAVTVVAVPAGSSDRPMPDRRFLAAVEAQLNRVRPIGTYVTVVPPVYVNVFLSARVRCGDGFSEPLLREKLQDWFSSGRVGIGGVIRARDAAALIQAIPGVLQVRDTALQVSGTGCVQNGDGDIFLDKCAIPCLGGLRLSS